MFVWVFFFFFFFGLSSLFVNVFPSLFPLAVFVSIDYFSLFFLFFFFVCFWFGFFFVFVFCFVSHLCLLTSLSLSHCPFACTSLQLFLFLLRSVVRFQCGRSGLDLLLSHSYSILSKALSSDRSSHCPCPSLSLSFAALVLHCPCPLLSLSFTVLVLYCPCPLLSLPSLLPVAPQRHLSNDVLVVRSD